MNPSDQSQKNARSNSNFVENIFNISLNKLVNWCTENKFQGFDPYDTLNSPINFKVFGQWGPPIAIQIQKRNPVNIREVIGVKKGYNPKGMGLFLKAYSLLYQKTGNKAYLENADWLFHWLRQNYSIGYSGYCWGYNFDWANPEGYLPAYTPSVVVTSFVIDGVYSYYLATGNHQAIELINGAANYIIKDIPITELDTGISFAYTHFSNGCCYNASLLAAEILSKSDSIENNTAYKSLIRSAVDFVLSKQKEHGEWWYSYNPEKKTESKQIDFHQGFVLVSLENLKNIALHDHDGIHNAIMKGLNYYKKVQFFDNGQSMWRIPRKWPVDIHNQSQGIITFSRLGNYDNSYPLFAETIAKWTIEQMQDESGYFYFRKTPLFINKISYMRWSQAWMMLALVELY